MKSKRRILQSILIAELIIVGAVFNLAVVLSGGLWLSEWIFPELWGSHELGNNLYKWDGNGDDAILFGSDYAGRRCIGGSYIVPSYMDLYICGKKAEYVKEYKFDKSSIIVLTDNNQTGERKYYIISKAFNPDYTDGAVIRARYLKEFTDSAEFIACCEMDSIGLRFR